jgi:hypothetical protein
MSHGGTMPVARVRYVKLWVVARSFVFFYLFGGKVSCSGHGLSPQWPWPAGRRKRYTTERALTLDNPRLTTMPASLPFDPPDGPCHFDQQSSFRYVDHQMVGSITTFFEG